MKKVILALAAIILSIGVNAQVMKIYKGSTLVKTYSSTEADKVVFEKEATTVEPVTTELTGTHSISVTVLSGDGKLLSASPVVKLNGQTMTKSADGSFVLNCLSNGTYMLNITCTGYKSVSETVTLNTTVVEGVNLGMNVVKTYYLVSERISQSLGFGGATDQITIETTELSYGDGTSANSTLESISVEAEIPTVTGADYTSIDAQIKAQSDNTEGIADYKISLTNITSLEDAQAVAKVNRIAASRMTRATTAMPSGNELLTGFAINAGPYVISMPFGSTFDITIKMPDDVKDAITLFRTFRGDRWGEVTSEDSDIASIDTSRSGVIVIKLNRIRTQSFALGFVVNETVQDTRYEEITANSVLSPVAQSTMTIPYQVKAGAVLTTVNSSSPALTDFLCKMIIRKYGIQAVKQPKAVTRNYALTSGTPFHDNGTVYLHGYQAIEKSRYSVTTKTGTSDASFTAEVYGDAFIAPYEEWGNFEPIDAGGSNE